MKKLKEPIFEVRIKRLGTRTKLGYSYETWKIGTGDVEVDDVEKHARRLVAEDFGKNVVFVKLINVW